MNLYTIEWPMNVWWDDREHHLVWANSEDEAIKVANENREGDCEYEHGRVSMHEGVEATPKQNVPHEERRFKVMRLCGWREDADTMCEECELYGMGIVRVCGDCCVCDECGGCVCE